VVSLPGEGRDSGPSPAPSATHAGGVRLRRGERGLPHRDISDLRRSAVARRRGRRSRHARRSPSPTALLGRRNIERSRPLRRVRRCLRGGPHQWQNGRERSRVLQGSGTAGLDVLFQPTRAPTLSELADVAMAIEHGVRRYLTRRASQRRSDDCSPGTEAERAREVLERLARAKPIAERTTAGEGPASSHSTPTIAKLAARSLDTVSRCDSVGEAGKMTRAEGASHLSQRRERA
jgi:hypothetical protein